MDRLSYSSIKVSSSVPFSEHILTICCAVLFIYEVTRGPPRGFKMSNTRRRTVAWFRRLSNVDYIDYAPNNCSIVYTSMAKVASVLGVDRSFGGSNLTAETFFVYGQFKPREWRLWSQVGLFLSLETCNRPTNLLLIRLSFWNYVTDGPLVFEILKPPDGPLVAVFI